MRRSVCSPLPKHVPVRGRHVEADTAVTPGSAATPSRMDWWTMTAARRLAYWLSGSPTRNVSADVGLKPGSTCPHFLKAAEHQPRRDHQHERQGHLASHQQVTRVKAAAARRVAPSVLVQRRGQRRDAQQRNRAERDAGEQAQHEREPDDDAVQPDFTDAGKIRRPVGHDGVDRGPGDGQPDDASGDGEQGALGQEVAHQGAACWRRAPGAPRPRAASLRT